MTQADLERRIHLLEQKVVDLERSLAVVATGVALARWMAPFIVSVITVAIILSKGT